jgi:hypothetical protein
VGTLFKQFKEEIKRHGEGGYHSINPALADRGLWDELNKGLNTAYTEFLTQIGTGNFYAENLQLFAIGYKRFKQYNSYPQEAGYTDYIAIGYDGTTEGCFWLKKDSSDTSVHWFNYPAQEVSMLYKDFTNWIEHTPQEMLNENAFKAY